MRTMARPIYELLLKGQRVRVNGIKNVYCVKSALTKNVFKGHLEGPSTPVVLKTEDHPVLYEREVNVYQFDSIQKSPYLRSMREIIDNGSDKCMVFEWLDSDLWSLRDPEEKRLPSSLLLKVVAKSVLRALTAFQDMDGQGSAVHTDVNPNNIMVSGATSSAPVAKLADLGNLILAGQQRDYRLQGLPIRAPEIWMGKPPSPACDVWSVGVTLAHFITSRVLFGANDRNAQIESFSPETNDAAWSIGKIMQLIGPLKRQGDARFNEEFDLAEVLVAQEIIKMNSLKRELGKLEAPKDCVEFIEYLLALEPDKRPTAAEALSHPWLEDVN